MSTSLLQISDCGLRIEIQLYDPRSGSRDVPTGTPVPPIGGTMIVPPEVFWAAFRAFWDYVNELFKQQNDPPAPGPVVADGSPEGGTPQG
jgi:hypothetical protein